MKRAYLWPFIILFCLALISATLFGGSKLRGQNSDVEALSGEPSDSFVFALELGGQVLEEYTECFGLGSSNEVEESVIQTNAGAVKKKTPGALEWHNITLRRMGPGDGQVWQLWRKPVEDGKLNEAIQDGAIIMSRAGSSEALARWNFSHGWPASLTIEGSVEVLTIVHDGLQRVPPNFDTTHWPDR
jgi:hypothetical protein